MCVCLSSSSSQTTGKFLKTFFEKNSYAKFGPNQSRSLGGECTQTKENVHKRPFWSGHVGGGSHRRKR